MTEPTQTKLVRLAEPGELRGFTITGELSEAFTEAMELALDHPGRPVLVENFDPADGTDEAVEAASTAAKASAKAGIRLVNKADHDNGSDPAVERFHVGYSAPPTGKSAYTVYLVFYPDGRPKRARGKGTDEAPASDEAAPAAD